MRQILVASLFLILAACQSSEPIAKKSKRIPTVVPKISTGLGSSVPYQPNGREEFVFAHKPELMQHFGYSGFCAATQHCEERLPYGLYVGKKGYFEQATPVAREADRDVYRVVLESGERYYYFASRTVGGRYGPVAPIVPLSKRRKVEDFHSEPIVLCSSLYTTESFIEFGETYYRLNNGRKVSEQTLQLIRQVAGRYGRNADAVIRLLLDLGISQAVESGRIRIGPISELKDNDIRLYMLLDQSQTELRFMVKYFGIQWLNLRALEFVADDKTWQAKRLQFQRKDSEGQIEEWVDVKAGTRDLKLARELAQAKKASVRLEGAGYFDELILSPIQKEDLLRVLELHELMKSSGSPPHNRTGC